MEQCNATEARSPPLEALVDGHPCANCPTLSFVSCTLEATSRCHSILSPVQARSDQASLSKEAQEALERAGGSTNETDAKRAQERKQEQEEQRRMALVSLMSPEARERLNRIAIVKPEKARMVENHILRMARGRPMADKIGEGQVISLLEQVNKELDKKQAVKVTMKRKAYIDEDDDDGILDEEF